MNIQRRLDQLEAALNRGDGIEPCEVCGAPSNAIRSEGVHAVIIPDDAADRDCAACGRPIDPETGKPIVAPTIIKIIRATPPPSHRQ